MKAQKLAKADIEDLLKAHPRAKRIAVENFLWTVGNNPNALAARMNLSMDARLYRWNSDTIQAIKAGISIAFG